MAMADTQALNIFSQCYLFPVFHPEYFEVTDCLISLYNKRYEDIEQIFWHQESKPIVKKHVNHSPVFLKKSW